MSVSEASSSIAGAGCGCVAPAVLGPSDCYPAEMVNPIGKGRFIFGCEHAGNKVPARLGTLGLSEMELTRHIAWDIGARRLTELLSARTDSPGILQRYSRLVYDCNRTIDHPGAFVTDADGSRVTGNSALSDLQKTMREREIYRPFHQELTSLIECRRQRAERFAYIAVHSFNETVRGEQRPWHIGFIYNQQSALSKRLIQWFQDNTNHIVGDNEPYSPVDAVDHTIRVQAEVRSVPYTMIEVRNDLLRNEDDIAYWADQIAYALEATVDE
ncbi:N-formylglutamate amidohydrolase [Salipiger thiooxidans]|uniref:N-formylglutamate amidohydrolase n=1 Tax=Salipiger thiooxidans TaxID=282683 RepID=UPI001CFA7845|nr:N-formylglutamate amidohydrolase [Salipiger thiooxidans]